MEIEGKIIMDIPLEQGTSKAGNPWKKKCWVLETFGQYPRQVKFDVFGDRAETLNFEVGKSYAVSFDLESREWNGRWYTDVRAFNCRLLDGQPPVQGPNGFPAFNTTPQTPAAPQNPINQAPVAPQQGVDFMEPDPSDELPF